ncbi:MAG: TolC family protein, partial [Deltaproteobacteria bacterium]|nr:TolC family protein [Deltaproteobacteria bacterium]
FYKQGMIAYNDLLKSKVALSHAIQQRVKAKSELEMAISSFNTLLMLDINQKSEVQDLLKERSFNFSLDTLFIQAMRNRPELKALRLALKNAGLAIKLAKSSYFPKIFLIGSYEQTGDNLTATNNDYGNDHNASITLLMQWTFFEWGKKRNETEKYRYKKLELLQQLRSIENSIKVEVKNAYLKLKVAEENIKTAKKSLEQARENFRITNLQYKQQMTTSTEVLDARTFLTQAETNYYSSLYGYEIAFAELERAVGKRLERSK